MNFFEDLRYSWMDHKRGSGKIISCATVFKRVLKDAKRNAIGMGEGKAKEVPNHYIVLISEEDWCKYYSERVVDVTQRLTVFLRNKVHDSRRFQMMGEPVVSIDCDRDLFPGEIKVNCSFVKLSDRARYKNGARSVKDIANGLAALHPAEVTQVSVHDGKTLRRDFMHLSPLDCTPVFETHQFQAKLTGWGQSYPVHPGSTIGKEDGQFSEADILLGGKESRYISHVHGEFACNGGNWVFRNTGKNGTKVRLKNGEARTLGLKDTCRLEDGCSISFAEEDPFVFNCDF